MNPAEMPLDVENLTGIQNTYGWVMKKKDRKGLTREILLYRLAGELREIRTREALAAGQVKAEKSWTAGMKK